MQINNSCVHCLLVADEKADDIEKGVKADRITMLSAVKEIARLSGSELKLKIFSGDKKDPELLVQHIKKLKAGPNDIVFFYFSGHGLRTKETKESEWPCLSFEKSDKMLKFGSIVQELSQKQARLTLLFADCCNNMMKIKDAPDLITVRQPILPRDYSYSQIRFSDRKISPAFLKLFREARGLLAVSSAPPGKYALSDDKKGSDFTRALKLTLVRAASNDPEDTNWTTFMEKLNKNLIRIAHKDGNKKRDPIVFNAIELG